MTRLTDLLADLCPLCGGDGWWQETAQDPAGEPYPVQVHCDHPAIAAFVDTEPGSELARLVERAEALEAALVDMVRQHAYWSENVGGLWTGGLSANEDAFEALGWDDPHPMPSMRCDEPECMRQATCGWPTRPGGTGLNGGYRRTCGEHMRSAALRQSEGE